MNPKKVRQAKTAAGVLVRSIPHKNVLTPPPTSKSNYTLLRRIMEVESHLCLEENNRTWASGGHLPPSSTSMTQTLLENGNIPILGWLEGSMQAMTCTDMDDSWAISTSSEGWESRSPASETSLAHIRSSHRLVHTGPKGQAWSHRLVLLASSLGGGAHIHENVHRTQRSFLLITFESHYCISSFVGTPSTDLEAVGWTWPCGGVQLQWFHP